MVTDAHALANMALGGVIHEDIMDKIHDISKIPLPFTSRIGSTSHTNQKFEWRVDRLAAPIETNAILDSAESKADESVQQGGQEFRVGNYSQISTKALHVSTRAQAVSTIGYAKSLAYQVLMRGAELRRDVEARSMSNEINVLDTGAGGTAGETAGLECWLDDENVLNDTVIDTTAGNPSQIRDQSEGITAHGGWTNRTGEILKKTDYTAMATPGAITEVAIKDVVEQLYENGADPTVLMGRPSCIRRISEFQFTSAARIATLTNQDGAASNAQRVAQGSVNVMVTDFSVLELVPNRLQPRSGDDTPESDTVFIFDPGMLSISYLIGYRTIPLAVDGLQEKRLIHVDWGLRVGNWEGLGGLIGINPATAMTAT